MKLKFSATLGCFRRGPNPRQRDEWVTWPPRDPLTIISFLCFGVAFKYGPTIWFFTYEFIPLLHGRLLLYAVTHLCGGSLIICTSLDKGFYNYTTSVSVFLYPLIIVLPAKRLDDIWWRKGRHIEWNIVVLPTTSSGPGVDAKPQKLQPPINKVWKTRSQPPWEPCKPLYSSLTAMGQSRTGS